jgi:hypothetical protein
MTDKQRHLFATKLSELPEMGKYSQGQKATHNLLYVLLKCFKIVKIPRITPLSSKSWFQSA